MSALDVAIARSAVTPLVSIDLGEAAGAPAIEVRLRSAEGELYELIVFGAASANDAVLAAEEHLEQRHGLDAAMEEWWPA